MSPKTWMTMVYFERYLELEKLARLGVGYLTYSTNISHPDVALKKLKSLDNFYKNFAIVFKSHKIYFDVLTRSYDF